MSSIGSLGNIRADSISGSIEPIGGTPPSTFLFLRITSYNVCYTKLLRVCRRKRICLPLFFAARPMPTTIPLIALAPWDPPIARTVKGGGGGEPPSDCAADSTISRRTGFPYTDARPRGRNNFV